ncbi:hypothetical protein V7S43_009762 [Phytophthora oleae]|uniref:PH domain-containing protein n=1 Tax=Phytophthora oleae TaxID=2107226 RepID=A0ABD3FDW9_9STRA
MSKMMVNGVDISMLEGWMIKINSNPSFFGKNMNRRWFKVGFVSGSGSQEKLVISYSTSKTAKEPRGWLYVEDVSGIYCRREMIEIVAPSRTLRLKGETAVEHRLWSDSLYKLCNPPPKPTAAAVKSTPAEPRQERTPQREEEEDREQRNRRSDRERERERERDRERDRDRERERRSAEDDRKRGNRSARSNRHDNDREDRENRREHDRSRRRSPRDDYDDYDARKRRSPSPEQREVRRFERQSSRRSHSSRHEKEEEIVSSREPVSSCASEQEDSGDDSSEDGRDSPRPSTTSSSRSLLVAQIKSGSSFEALDVAQCKNIMSDSEEEEDAYRYERKQDPEEESPREPVMSSTSPIEDEARGDLQHLNLNRTVDIQVSKRKNSEYFDSDEEQESSAPPSKSNTKTPISSVTSDNNFVHDDWDEEEPSTPAPTKASYPTVIQGVAADANFVHDDWDD